MRIISQGSRVAAAVILLVATSVAAQERATGTVTMEQPTPQPRGFTVEQGGRALTGVIPPGGAVDISGANVVVEETPRATKLTVSNDVLFDFDKSELRPEAAEALGRVAQIIRQRQPREVRIVGHTDSIGTDAYNQALSERRAASVETWLAAHAGSGLPPMQAVGHGEQEPVAPNIRPDGTDNPEGRQQNRRVEVLLKH
jgi:outer membrane protein OmpA-like peptidoglycan-associated protein